MLSGGAQGLIKSAFLPKSAPLSLVPWTQSDLHSAVGKTPPFLLPLRDSQDSADLTELRRFLFASSISKRGESKALPPCWAAAFRSDGFPSRPAPLCALSSACSHCTAPRGPTAPTRLQVGRPNLWDFPSSSLEDDFILFFFKGGFFYNDAVDFWVVFFCFILFFGFFFILSLGCTELLI